MNVIVLTPDRVGSTLLQRLITIYMAGHEYDKPVINLHELTNGLELFWNETYQQQILGKPPKGSWGYYQSLEQVVDLLDQADHYKTCRLAQYHIVSRQDSLQDQIRFYNYINENFFVISARRKNLFEHGISWGIYLHSKKLNVYTHEEKINTFYNIYKDGVTIDPESLVKYLDRYRDYLKWCDQHFHINTYFNYEDDLKDIEKFVMNLDIFPGGAKKTWKDIFSIEWSDWNQCHKLISDLGSVEPLKLEHIRNTESNQIVTLDKLRNQLTVPDQAHLKQHGQKYVQAYMGIEGLVKNGTLVTGVPIKLQTMSEKRQVIKNFDQCVEVYNKWVDRNGLGDHYTNTDLKQIANEESKFWYKQVPDNLLIE